MHFSCAKILFGRGHWRAARQMALFLHIVDVTQIVQDVTHVKENKKTKEKEEVVVILNGGKAEWVR